jgi:3',5'-cyclic AMP phosphodiesterase CpdA
MARLLQISDLHIVAPGALASGRLDTGDLLRRAIDALLARLAALGPLDAVLVTGDISDDGSAASYDIARRELDRLGLPLLVIPGNHDCRDALRRAFADLPTMPPTGLIDWRLDMGETTVIGLDTLVEGQGGGRLRPESVAFLSDALDASRDRPLLLALHHPPLRTGIRFMDAIGLENSDALAAVLARRSAPVRIVAGHVHGVHHGALGPHTIVTAPSTCSAFALDRRVDAPIGFMTGPTGCAVIEIGADWVWTAVPLDHGAGPFKF